MPVVAISENQKHRISVVDERISCAADQTLRGWIHFDVLFASLVELIFFNKRSYHGELWYRLRNFASRLRPDAIAQTVSEPFRGCKPPTRILVLAGQCLSKSSFRSISISPISFLRIETLFVLILGRFVQCFSSVTGWFESIIEALLILYKKSTIPPRERFPVSRYDERRSPREHPNVCKKISTVPKFPLLSRALMS